MSEIAGGSEQFSTGVSGLVKKTLDFISIIPEVGIVPKVIFYFIRDSVYVRLD